MKKFKETGNFQSGSYQDRYQLQLLLITLDFIWLIQMEHNTSEENASSYQILPLRYIDGMFTA